MLEIKDLNAGVGEKLILRGLNLTINAGETHVLMGRNGTGKSTLAAVVAGSPAYAVTGGQVLFDGADITREPPDKRARRGIFLSFQSPEEIPGVTLEEFLRAAKGAVTGETPRLLAFQKELYAKMDALGFDRAYASRELNVGFSGGEKKKAEILQLLVLNPKLAILDEADSGLDVDAVRVVSAGIKSFRGAGNALLIITHNARIVGDVVPDRVHILDDKTISRTGGAELIEHVSESGFGALPPEANA